MTDVPADQGRPQWPSGPSGPRNGMGVAALVFGVVGVLLGAVVIGGVLGIVAVVLGILALGRVRRGEANNRGVAIIGIVAGALAVVIAAGALALILSNADEIEDLGDCLEDADTERERDDCANRFEDEIEN
jgi:Domain of unknown function (DUF4190)